MKFIFYSPVCFEKWDWRNSVEKGIGGSETSHVEMAWRLARRGHDILTYAPIPEDCPGEWRGTAWKRLEEVDKSQAGIWVLYRCPKFIDDFDADRTDQPKWLIMQDWDYPDLTPERAAKFSRIVPLCHAHERWLINRHPYLAGKTWVTRNGIKLDLIEEAEQDPPERNPKRIMYASSPDRGLLAALKIFQRAKEYDPELELHITYGWNNLDKLIGDNQHHPFRKTKEQCLKLIEQTGAIYHGRMSQGQLYREWLKTAMNVYCTDFWETGYITGLEGMALGAIPIFSPIWAQGENLDYGIAIHGNPNDPLTLARFTDAVVHVAGSLDGQQAIRHEMMEFTRRKWSWEVFVDQWIDAGWEDMAKQPCSTLVGVVTPIADLIKPQKPLISILTPSIRPEGLPMLYECLKKQTYTNWEWLLSVPKDQVEKVAGLLFKEPVNNVIVIQAEPAKRDGDLYNLNKAWNQLVKSAGGKLLVFTTDWLWCEDKALEKLYGSVLGCEDKPRRLVTAAPDHFDTMQSPVAKPENRVWQDYRGNDAEFFDVGPENVELVLAAVPTYAVREVGGFDEEYDKVAGLSEKELCLRLKSLLKFRFYVDKSIECRSVVHEKEWPGWDKLFAKACEKFGEHQADLLSGKTKKLTYMDLM